MSSLSIFHPRSFRIIISAVLCTLAFYGCPTPPPEIVVLGEDSANIKALEQLKDRYRPTSPVTIRFAKETFEDAENKANQDFFNKAGKYDIVLLYNFSLSGFVRNNYVYRLSELKSAVPDSRLSFEKALFPAAWLEVGHYYTAPYTIDQPSEPIGYPFATNTMLLVYNRDLFSNSERRAAYAQRHRGRELAPPTTWEDFRIQAEFFTDQRDADPTKHTFGLCLQGAAEGWLYYEWMNVLFGHGGKTMAKDAGWKGDEKTHILLDSPEAIRAAKFYLSLKPFTAGDFFTTKPEKQIERLRSGTVAMAIMWSDYIPELVGSGQDRPAPGPKFGFAPIPGPVSMLAGGPFFVNKESKHRDEAFRYIVHVMQEEMQVELAKRGLASPMRSIYNHPQVKALPYAEALSASLERGVYMNEAGPDANLVRDVVEKHLQRLWNAGGDVDAAMKKAKAEIDAERQKIFALLRQKSQRKS